MQAYRLYFVLFAVIAIIGLVFYYLIPWIVPRIVSSSPRLMQYATFAPGFARPDYMDVDPKKPWRQQTRLLEIAGRKFNIPLAYVEGHLAAGEHQDGVLLTIIWPDLQSIYDMKSRQEYEKIQHEQRTGNIGVREASLRPSIAQQMANRRKSLGGIDFIGKNNGLEEYTFSFSPKPAYVPEEKFYIEKNGQGEAISYIDCEHLSPTPDNPLFVMCDHTFSDKDIIYSITYNKANYFSDWRKQRQSAIDFINSFEVKTNNPSSGR